MRVVVSDLQLEHNSFESQLYWLFSDKRGERGVTTDNGDKTCLGIIFKDYKGLLSLFLVITVMHLRYSIKPMQLIHVNPQENHKASSEVSLTSAGSFHTNTSPKLRYKRRSLDAVLLSITDQVLSTVARWQYVLFYNCRYHCTAARSIDFFRR